MRNLFIFLLVFLVPVADFSTKNKNEFAELNISEFQTLYDEMNLDGIVNYNAFEQTMKGYFKLNIKNKDIITLIDFSRPSTEERMYIFDMRHKRLLSRSYVSHGRNSGGNYATSFSNEVGSFKSSLGFYLTENTYNGKNGYSLILNGLEKGINDKAKERAIVIHGAAYSNPSTILSSGRLGRSLGCPALPLAVSKSIINTIKEGTLLYIYANNSNYMAQSQILSKNRNSL